MYGITFRYQVKDGVDFNKIVPYLRRQLLRSMRTFGRKAETRIRHIVRSGQWAKNSPPWIAIKGSDRPLYNTGHLSTSIQSQVMRGVGDSFVEVEVGWIDKSTHPQAGGTGGNIHNIINILTSGASWQPSVESKAAFWAKVPKEWKQNNLPTNKGTWTTPARDFMTKVHHDPMIAKWLIEYISQASVRAMRDSKKGNQS